MAHREGFHTATPYMVIRNAAAAMEFYKNAFGAIELGRHADPDGKVRHGEIKIGDSPIMICDEFGDFPQMRSAQALGGSPVQVFLYVDDADALAAQAQAAGATLFHPMQDQHTDAPEVCRIHSDTPGGSALIRIKRSLRYGVR